MYKALANLEMPRAFKKIENENELNLETSIFELPLTCGAINKLYGSGFNTLGDCLNQTPLSKQILGGKHFEEVSQLMVENGWQINFQPLADNTKLSDLFLPSRLNVVFNEQIINDHNAWHNDYINWVLKPEREGIYNLADLKEYGLNRFEMNYGVGFKAIN